MTENQSKLRLRVKKNSVAHLASTLKKAWQSYGSGNRIKNIDCFFAFHTIQAPSEISDGGHIYRMSHYQFIY